MTPRDKNNLSDPLFAHQQLSNPLDDVQRITEMVVKYNGDIYRVKRDLDVEVEVLSENYAIITLSQEKIPKLYAYKEIEYIEQPKKLAFVLNKSLQQSCIANVQNKDKYGLSGKDVAIGIIDSGITYIHPDFRNEDGTTRILYMWDQEGMGLPPDGFTQGAEYDEGAINEALEQQNPLEAIGEVDFIGHGTVVAGIAAGNGRLSKGENTGVAPEAALIIVKLGQKGGESFAMTTELMRAIKYVIDKAQGLNMPVAVNLSFGTNDGSHDGNSLFESYISDMSEKWKTVIVVASGNEGSAGHHYGDRLDKGGAVDIDFVVSGSIKSFFISLWKNFVDIFVFEIISPSGENTGELTYTVPVQRVSMEQTDLNVLYGQPNHYNYDQEVYFGFSSREGFITQGIWTLRIKAVEVVEGGYDIWMPIAEAVGVDTAFLKPTANMSLTLPSTTEKVISVGGYDANINAIAEFSGRGYTRNNVYVKPDIVAPAVGILSPTNSIGYDSYTGTSMAAPFVTGSAALMMEWGIVMGNDPFLYGQRVKAFLRLGATRRPEEAYPNPQWGYGSLCLENTMNYLEDYTKNMNKNMSSLNNKEDLTRQEPPLNQQEMSDFITSENTVDFYIRYTEYIEQYAAERDYIQVSKILSGGFVVAYAAEEKMREIVADIGGDSYNLYPKVLGLTDRESLEVSGITQVQNQPYLDLRGTGTIIGFIDTGIDYTNAAFKYEDGTSKIAAIWDQTLKGNPPEEYLYGSEFSNEDINRALEAPDPFSIVPHRDTVGHGTFLASVACGEDQGENIGAAPEAEIIMVKIKKAKAYYYEKYLVPEEQENAYETTDLMLGIDYILHKALKLGKPVAICIGLGSNYGSHDGLSTIEQYMASLSTTPKVAICVAGGNESNAKHHTDGKINIAGGTAEIQLKVGVGENGIYLSVWNHATDRMSLSIKSPTGEIIPRIHARSGMVNTTKLILEKSEVTVEYYFPVAQSGGQLSLVKIIDPTPGLWSITVYGDIILNGVFHSWLPQTGFVKDDTVFLSPKPNYTITCPGTCVATITCGAYSPYDGALSPSSSWGPTRLSLNLPTFVAPGVNVGGVYPSGDGVMSGSSVATAITAGACALMLQWGIVDMNDTTLNTRRIRSYLIKGCDRDEGVAYPSQQWGYGKLDLIRVFNLLRQI